MHINILTFVSFVLHTKTWINPTEYLLKIQSTQNSLLPVEKILCLFLSVTQFRRCYSFGHWLTRCYCAIVCMLCWMLGWMPGWCKAFIRPLTCLVHCKPHHTNQHCEICLTVIAISQPRYIKSKKNEHMIEGSALNTTWYKHAKRGRGLIFLLLLQ